METPLMIAILFGSAVIFLCFLIFIVYYCYHRYRKTQAEKEPSEESVIVDSVTTPNIIMTRKDRTEDIFTGKRMPFGVHSSMTNIPDEVNKEGKEDQTPENYGNNLQPNGFKPQYGSSILRNARQSSTKSNAPSFSEYAGEENSPIHY